MPDWYLTRDGDDIARSLFDRHYSRVRYADGRTPKLFVGPGEKLVLRTIDGRAVFAWRVFIDDCIDERTGGKQQGVNCAIFRNESPIPSSELIRQADAIADCCWPDRRHYTYVKPSAIKSSNPGWCFQCAGWAKCGVTKSGLVVLERV